MFFDYLNPFHWIKTILSVILILALILIPGWKVVFTDKSFFESLEMLADDFWNTVSKAFSEAFSYYRSWFQSDETQDKIEEGKDKAKEKAIEELEKKIEEEKQK